MKCLPLFLCFFYGLLIAQAQDIAGVYEAEHKTVNAYISYQLVLNSDGTFSFKSYSNHSQKLNPEEYLYGKGKWKSDNTIISFLTDKQKDFDEKHTLDFDKTKARFISKSPRDKSDRIIKTALKFVDSQLFWVKGMDLFKVE